MPCGRLVGSVDDIEVMFAVTGVALASIGLDVALDKADRGHGLGATFRQVRA